MAQYPTTIISTPPRVYKEVPFIGQFIDRDIMCDNMPPPYNAERLRR
jgi:hypothetical protein